MCVWKVDLNKKGNNCLGIKQWAMISSLLRIWMDGKALLLMADADGTDCTACLSVVEF